MKKSILFVLSTLVFVSLIVCLTSCNSKNDPYKELVKTIDERFNVKSEFKNGVITTVYSRNGIDCTINASICDDNGIVENPETKHLYSVFLYGLFDASLSTASRDSSEKAFEPGLYKFYFEKMLKDREKITYSEALENLYESEKRIRNCDAYSIDISANILEMDKEEFLNKYDHRKLFSYKDSPHDETNIDDYCALKIAKLERIFNHSLRLETFPMTDITMLFYSYDGIWYIDPSLIDVLPNYSVSFYGGTYLSDVKALDGVVEKVSDGYLYLSGMKYAFYIGFVPKEQKELIEEGKHISLTTYQAINVARNEDNVLCQMNQVISISEYKEPEDIDDNLPPFSDPTQYWGD